MKDVYVVYWSSTGNTQAMAEAVGAGAESAGATAHVVEVASADASALKDVPAFALGASAMGAEELDSEMDDFVTQVEAFASGKTIALFGSYDWGDGEWIRTWTSRIEEAGAKVIGGEDCIANLTPDDEALDKCKAIGAELANL